MTDKQMTIEQAIRLLDPETRADALCEIHYYNGFRGKEACAQAVSDACELACEIMRDYMHTKDVLAGMEIMLAQAQSAAQTYERQLNTALDHMRGNCRFCRHDDPEYQCNECMDCIRGCNWVWKGEPESTREA